MSTHEEELPDLDDCLLVIAEDSSVPPSWLDEVRHLEADSTAEQRLAVYQAVRDSGWLTEDEGLYLVASQVEEMADGEAATNLRDLNNRIEAIEKEAGIKEGQPWPDDWAADEYDELSRRYQEAWDGLFVGKLKTLGEHDVADLYLADPDEFT